MQLLEMFSIYLELLWNYKKILTLWEIFVWTVDSQLLQLFPWFEQ